MFIEPVFHNGFQLSDNGSLWDLWWDITLLHCLFFFPPPCINGANRNYQILCFSLKPSYWNPYLTMLRQASEMTSTSFNGFAGGSKCEALLQHLLSAWPHNMTVSCCAVAVLQPWRMETCMPQHTRKTSSQTVLWMRPYKIIHACHSLVAVRSVCTGSLHFLRPPEEGNEEFLINSANHLKGNFSSSQFRV